MQIESYDNKAKSIRVDRFDIGARLRPVGHGLPSALCDIITGDELPYCFAPNARSMHPTTLSEASPGDS